MPRIKKPHAVFIIVLVVIGILILRFGQFAGLNDVVIAGLSAFTFAMAASYLTFAYEEGKTEKERQENAKQALKAISSELRFNLEQMGEGTEHTNNAQFAPDKLTKISLNGVANAGFLTLLSIEQQQLIFGAYRRLNRIEMWSDYGIVLLASGQAKSLEILGYISQQGAILRNELRQDIKSLLPKLDGWINELEN